MLIVREKQMAVLENHMNDKFVKELVNHLADDFPAECKKNGLNKENLEPFVRKGLSNAKETYGIEYRDDLTFFIECTVLLALDFDQNEAFPWAKDILRDETMSGVEKMAAMDEYMIFNLDTPT